MARPRYGITALVDPDPLGWGHYTEGMADGSVPAKHKWNTEASPYCVPNELICGTIGQFLGLPIPAFALTHPSGGKPAPFLFSSLHFNFEGRQLSPVMPSQCVAALAELCAGIVVFDVLIGNADRHDANLAVDRMEKPKEMRVFDHDCALFGANCGGNLVGVARLHALKGRLGVTGSELSSGNRHCLLDAMTDSRPFAPWVYRLWQLNGDFIRRTCAAAVNFGLSNDEAEEAANFIDHRSRSMRSLLNRHSCEFEGIEQWSLI